MFNLSRIAAHVILCQLILDALDSTETLTGDKVETLKQTTQSLNSNESVTKESNIELCQSFQNLTYGKLPDVSGE